MHGDDGAGIEVDPGGAAGGQSGDGVAAGSAAGAALARGDVEIGAGEPIDPVAVVEELTLNLETGQGG